MARTTPVIRGGVLIWYVDAQEHQLNVDTPAWYAWLEEASTFAFVGERGTFTARKELSRHGGAYWKAYRKRAGKLRRAYLGKSEDVSLARLNAAAEALADQEVPLVPKSLSTARFEQPPHILNTRPSNLPMPLTSLVGREHEIAAACTLLRRPEVRLLTLTGTGGVGKTRLALSVAATMSSDFEDGVRFVSLAPLTDPELVVSTIGQALGVREQGNRPLLDGLKDYLRDRQMLLLLDNFEQIIAAAPVGAQLLAEAPRLKVLVTSRTPLHLYGEHEFVVPPLSLPDLRNLPPLDHLTQFEAVRVFVERAQAVKSDFAITVENAAVIAAICYQLDGLPLAIELAAGRIKLFPPQALLPRLTNRLKLLVGGARDLPSRQQTLRGTLAWSYGLLDQAEKRLFRRLSVFVGGCTLEAAEAICNANRDLEKDVLDTVASLVDKGLLRQEEQADGEPRLLMLETIREYALERLGESGEAEVMRREHATFFLRLAEEAEPQMQSGEQSRWFKRLEVEHDNLRAALHWTLESQQAEMGLRLAGALYLFWRSCNHSSEGRAWFERALAQSGAKARTAARAKALLGAGAMAFFQGDFLEAHRLLEESVMVGREGGAAGKRDLATALILLGHVTLLQGNPGTARNLAEEGRQLFQEVGENWGVALALFILGKTALALGNPVTARALLEESATQFRVTGDKWRLFLPVDALGLVALRQGDYADARVQFEEALSVAQEMGDEQYIADALAHLGKVALSEGDYAQSAAFYQQSLALHRLVGNRQGIAEGLAGLAALTNPEERPKQAARLPVVGEILPARSSTSSPLSPRRALKQHFGGLTSREREVARLVAQGKSNRAIAEELVVGISTVEAHMTHIFTKLGFSSRAQIAAWAVDRGLAQASQDMEATRQKH